jgi:hypothetical protein
VGVIDRRPADQCMPVYSVATPERCRHLHNLVPYRNPKKPAEAGIVVGCGSLRGALSPLVALREVFLQIEQKIHQHEPGADAV